MADRKTKMSQSGAQYWQSDTARKNQEATPGATEMADLIRQALAEKVKSGEVSPQRAGRFSAKRFSDSVDDTYKVKYSKKGKK